MNCERRIVWGFYGEEAKELLVLEAELLAQQ